MSRTADLSKIRSPQARDHRQFDSGFVNRTRVRIWSGHRFLSLLGLVPAGTGHEPHGRLYSPTRTGRATLGLRA